MNASKILRRNRSELLDCIRAFAVAAVIWYHVGVELPNTFLDPIANLIASYGFLGVDIFFPLSGFLVTGFLLNHVDRTSQAVFFLRRFFRIVPLYYLALATYVAASFATGVDQEIIGEIWKNALFLTGWAIFFEGKDVIPYTITWSLSVEEVAYIILGIAAFSIRRYFVHFLIFLCVFSFLVRLNIILDANPLYYYFPPARLDSIAWGGLLAIGLARGLPMLKICAALTVVSFALQLSIPALSHAQAFTSITLLTCTFIALFVTHLDDFSSVTTRVLSSLGFYSYFVYLFHYFVIEALLILQSALGVSLGFWLTGLIVVLVTWGVAVISYRIFEGPIMLYGRQLEKRLQPRTS